MTNPSRDGSAAVRVARCGPADLDDLVRLRSALWPHATEAVHRQELAQALAGSAGEAALFLARTGAGEAVGFAEATLRHEPVNGCETSPVTFLEGIYLLPAYRRRGIAAALCGAVETWARSIGCTELGSDAEASNEAGLGLHAAFGFQERERVVCFGKRLGPAASAGTSHPTDLTLTAVVSEDEWRVYHAIRRAVLWEARMRTGYDDRHGDEHRPDHHPLLLRLDGRPIGTVRLDDRRDGTAVVRLVAIVADQQRRGHGRGMDALVMDVAHRLGAHTLLVNAAPDAVGFYAATGWHPLAWNAKELTGIAADCVQMRKVVVP